MLNDYFEPFVLLERSAAADGLGSAEESWQTAVDFRGALTQTCGEEIAIGGRATVRQQPVLLHETDVTLLSGDRIRRVRDGAVFLVRGSSDMMRPPAFSGLQFAQVPVERLVIPC